MQIIFTLNRLERNKYRCNYFLMFDAWIMNFLILSNLNMKEHAVRSYEANDETSYDITSIFFFLFFSKSVIIPVPFKIFYMILVNFILFVLYDLYNSVWKINMKIKTTLIKKKPCQTFILNDIHICLQSKVLQYLLVIKKNDYIYTFKLDICCTLKNI